MGILKSGQILKSKMTGLLLSCAVGLEERGARNYSSILAEATIGRIEILFSEIGKAWRD